MEFVRQILQFSVLISHNSNLADSSIPPPLSLCCKSCDVIPPKRKVIETKKLMFRALRVEHAESDVRLIKFQWLFYFNVSCIRVNLSVQYLRCTTLGTFTNIVPMPLNLR